MFEFIEKLDDLVVGEDRAKDVKPSVLVITKMGKYLRGHILEHNVRINSDNRMRGRLVMTIDGVRKEVDANDVSSVEKQL